MIGVGLQAMGRAIDRGWRFRADEERWTHPNGASVERRPDGRWKAYRAGEPAGLTYADLHWALKYAEGESVSVLDVA